VLRMRVELGGKKRFHLYGLRIKTTLLQHVTLSQLSHQSKYAPRRQNRLPVPSSASFPANIGKTRLYTTQIIKEPMVAERTAITSSAVIG